MMLAEKEPSWLTERNAGIRTDHYQVAQNPSRLNAAQHIMNEVHTVSYGASQKDILFLLITNQKGIYLTTLLIGFGRAISEYGAAAIVGGSIDHVTRNMTAMIALETAKGNILIGVTLGAILISVSLIISFGINYFKNDD